MIQLFETMKSALERRENVVLCSILASSGSAPRGAGAKMAVFQNGQTLGTIGGGAVERIAAQQAMDLFRTGASYCQAFCLAPNQVNDIGMICGGSVTVYFRFFDHENARDLELVKTILELLASGQDAWLISRMEQGKITAMGTFDEAHGLCRAGRNDAPPVAHKQRGLPQGRAVLLRRAHQPGRPGLYLRRRSRRKGACAGAGECRVPRGGV